MRQLFSKFRLCANLKASCSSAPLQLGTKAPTLPVVIARLDGATQMLWGSGGEGVDALERRDHAMEHPMSQSFDASRSLTAFEQDSTLVAVIEMSQSKWLVAAMIPGVARQPLKKLDANADALLKLLQRWQDEARKAGRTVRRIVCTYEAGRDGFWLARWLQARAIETYVIHAASIAVSREHRRA